MKSPQRKKQNQFIWTAYAIILVLFVGSLLWLLKTGNQIFPNSSSSIDSTTADTINTAFVGHPDRPLPSPLNVLQNIFAKKNFALFLLQIIVIFPLAHYCGLFFTRINQPAVVGEIIAGILLGPSILGNISPDIYDLIFPHKSLGPLRLMSQLGILIFMFIIGMESSPDHFKKRAHKAFFISHTGMFVPFVLAVFLSIFTFENFANPTVSFNSFALFMGISMSVTAFPVLLRILVEKRLTNTPVGSLAITSAAIGDLTAWSALAILVASIQSNKATSAVETIVSLLAFIFFAFVILRPILQKNVKDHIVPNANTLVLTLALIFMCSLCTELIGIHALFGAFIAGLVMPHVKPLKSFLTIRLENLTSTFLLPIFFAVTGVRTQIGLLQGNGTLVACLLILAVAIFGKMGGTYLASRIMKMRQRDALTLSSLMNARGLMELIILNLGYELGIFSDKMFAIMVFMALATTIMTGPMVTFFRKQKFDTA